MTDICRTKPMFPISVVADELKVHQRTLRIYDAEGILKPQRSGKNRRLYSMEDIDRGRLIQKMTNSGLNLAGIKVFFALTQTMPVEMKAYEFEAIAKESGLVVTINTKGRKIKK